MMQGIKASVPTDGGTPQVTDKLLESPDEKQEYKLYKRRWWILFAYSYVACQQSAFWLCYNALGAHPLTFYNISQSMLNFLGQLGPICYLPSVFLSSWIMHVLGLRAAVVFMTLLTMVCGVVRVLAISPKLFAFVIIGQIMNAIAGPVAMAAPPLISASWFGPHERNLSTAIGFASSTVGVAVAFLLAFMVQTDKQIMNLIYIEAGSSVIIAIAVFAYFPDAPPTPPSPSKELQKKGFQPGSIQSTEQPQTGSIKPFLKSLVELHKNVSFQLLCIAYGMSAGVFGCWSSVMDPILMPLGITEDQISWMGFWSNVAGIVGSLVIGKMADIFTKRYKVFLITFNLITTAAVVCFTLSVLKIILYKYWILMFSAIVTGLLVGAAGPIAYEMSVELTYPIPEGTSVGIITLWANIGCFVFQTADDWVSPKSMNWVFLILISTATVLYLIIRERYTRINIDMGDEKPTDLQ